MEAEGETKSKNQLKNEEKNKAKLEKFLAKQEKLKEQAARNAEKEKTRAVADALKPKSEEFIDETIPGEKKDMSAPMDSAYNPRKVETAWYSWWEKCGYFKPEYHLNNGSTKEPFVIPIPPPNVTGSLHLGHSMMVAIEDSIIRWKRMQGHPTLYIPGCDHAGIATQVVVEKKLKKEKNLLRQDIGREAFVKEVWEWKGKFGDRIYHQIKKMGTSVDWDRQKFTLDPDMNEAVTEAFIRMHEDGLIFRDNRLVNWSAKIQTSLSDLEVDHKTIAGNTWIQLPGMSKKYQFGLLYTVAYKAEEGDEEILVSTTRPETIIGDTGIAVNPKDPRYFSFHGKCVINPLNGRKIPVVTDEAALMDFGTGAVKLTPAHDYNDFAVGKKHNLQFLTIFDSQNNVNSLGGQFEGLNRFEARIAVVEFLKTCGAYRGEVPYEMNIPFCSRTGDIIEPRLIPQWWLNCKPMAKKAADAVRNKELLLVPEESDKVWFYFLDNIRDWCISRQLWWGHRIPAYFVNIKGDLNEQSDGSRWISGRNMDEVWTKVAKKFPNVPRETITLEQDPDVLDTWFSSGLWPFATLGWPKETPDLAKFYPSSVLETGRDIIFFWVARMVMMGVYLTGKLPFTTILLHSIVRDAHGRKMSKSLGNVIDPIDVIHGISLDALQQQLDEGNLDPKEVKIAKDGQKKDFPNGIVECGTDALRFALCACMSFGRDINLDILRVEGYRKFCNKIWNATKFALMKLGPDFVPDSKFQLYGNENLSDKWILNRINRTVIDFNAAMNEYNFMSATTAIHKFWIYELCDVYIEISKATLENEQDKKRVKNILYTCIENGLLMLSPFMPFITEELYQRLPRRENDTVPSIVVAPFPEESALFHHPQADQDFSLIFNIVKCSRSLMDSNSIKKADVTVRCANSETRSLLNSQQDAFITLAKGIASLKITSDESITAGTLSESISSELSVHVQKLH